MKSWLMIALMAPFAPLALAAATVGQPAPAFTATDVTGKPVSLADFKGRHVVLEWVNPGCPYVQKHYGAANMQARRRRPPTRAWSGWRSAPRRATMSTTRRRPTWRRG
jgi:hypothetical protein